MLETLLTGIASFLFGVSLTSLTFGMSLTNKVTTACEKIENLTYQLNKHISLQPPECPAHDAAFNMVRKIETQVAVNTDRLNKLENK